MGAELRFYYLKGIEKRKVRDIYLKRKYCLTNFCCFFWGVGGREGIEKLLMEFFSILGIDGMLYLEFFRI